MTPLLSWLWLALSALLVLSLVAQGATPAHRQVVGGALRASGRLLVGLALFGLILYATAYFLALVGGFYESLTCKVVTLPSCEDPLALPAWLGLPDASVGGVIGILPLLGIFLAKSFQGAARRAPAEATDAGAAGTVAAGAAAGRPERRAVQKDDAALAYQAYAAEIGAVDAAPPDDGLRDTAQPDGYARTGWRERLGPSLLSWLLANASLIAILFVELWLAWLRGAAEAADRQVRLSLGLDADLPAAYLGVAQWGAVVLALGLSVVVVYLGVAGRVGLRVAGLGFGELGYGGGLVDMFGAILAMLTNGVRRAWTVIAVVTGRLALKLQSAMARLFVLFVSAFGRLGLKLQSGIGRAWLFLALLVGRSVLFLVSVPSRVAGWFRRRPRGTRADVLVVLLAAAGAGALGVAHAQTTYVVLQDASGGEASRLEAANQRILSWADPSPQLALLNRNDRLVVIPVRAPGGLDTVYAALFNAAYQGSQLDRFAFFAELRNVLPEEVDAEWGTGLSEALRTAAFYLRDAPPEHERVLIVFGNGEDHSADPITPEELRPALEGTVVVRLNAGLDTMDHWTRLYDEAGAAGQVVFDQAATRLLTVEELRRAIERARGE